MRKKYEKEPPEEKIEDAKTLNEGSEDQAADGKTENEEERKKKRRKKIRRRILIALAIVVVLLVAAAVAASQFFTIYIDKLVAGEISVSADPETFALLSPVDPAQAAEIDALPKGDKDDTWAIYVYMNGSDLESRGRDNLSETMDLLLKDENDAFKAAQEEAKQARILDFADTVLSHGSFLPAALTMPDLDKGSDKSGNIAPDSEESALSSLIPTFGMSSIYLKELMKTELSDQVQVIVQPGGTKAWDIPDINPNRTQRFVVGNGRLNEVYNGDLENMGDPQTLTNFLQYCKKNYPADKTIVILWDHGGAARGFGWDEIYADDNLTLKELREGFSGAYTPNEQDPPIDLVYYHACLLSCAEMMDTMRGLCDYMLAGEEVGIVSPTITYYQDSISALCENPDIHPAQLARLFVDNYMNKIIGLTSAGYTLPTGLCVLDMAKAPAVYDAYGDFARAALEQTVEDPTMLLELNAAANQSTFFAQSSYKGYNTIDLGQFMDGMAEVMPEEAATVKQAIDEAVLYNRSDSYLIEADGISIYYPAHIETLGGLNVFLQYVNEICDNDDINALYYYKVAGCLPDELDEHLQSEGYGAVQTLDYTIVKDFNGFAVELDSKGDFTASPPKEVLDLVGDGYLQVARVEPEEARQVYLGVDRFIGLTESGVLDEDFEGKWLTIDGVNFPVSVIDSTEEAIKYQSRIKFKGADMYLILRYVFETEQFEILGLRQYKDSADLLDRNIIEISEGDTIRPLYQISDANGGKMDYYEGKSIKYSKKTLIEDGALTDGLYYARIVLEDLRSDRCYSQIMQFTMKDGKITDPSISAGARMSPVLE